MTSWPLSLIVLVALFAGACGAARDEPGTSPSTSPSTPQSTIATMVTTGVAPATSAASTTTATSAPTSRPTVGTATADREPVDMQLDWLVGTFEADRPPTLEEISERFTAEFLEQVPPDALVSTTAELLAGTEAPYTVASTEPQTPAGLATAAVIESADGTTFEIFLSVAAEPPHRIEALLISPSVTFPDDVTPDRLDDELARVGAESSLGVYEVTTGECIAQHEIRADRAMPLGSAFKLWVLAELAHQIDAGSAAWDETVTVSDELRSSPDGEVFSRATGTEITLRELAELMIAISDNTATDHLMARLGRANIEAALDRIGVSAAAQNIPMLSTGALFQLKFIAAAPNADDYRSLDATGRAAMLDELESATLPWAAGPEAVEPTNADGVGIGEPRDLDLEWFATPEDMCRTHVHLAELAERPGLEPVAAILEANAGAGLPFDRDRWPTIRFKGGSEPGVVAGAWWLERSDGRRFVIAGGISDSDTSFPQVPAVVAIASAIALVS